MKKILFILGIALSASSAIAQEATPSSTQPQPSAPAQRRHHTQMSAEQRATIYTNNLQKKLNLSQDQNTRILAVNIECLHRKDALKASGSQPGDGGFRDIAMYRHQQFASILSHGQIAQLKAMNAANKGKKGRRTANMNDDMGDTPPSGNQ